MNLKQIDQTIYNLNNSNRKLKIINNDNNNIINNNDNNSINNSSDTQ